MKFITKIFKTLILIFQNIIPLANSKQTFSKLKQLKYEPNKSLKFFKGLWNIIQELVSGLDWKATWQSIKEIWK